MKIIFGFICIIFCTYMGIIFSNKYTNRRKFFNAFLDFNKKIKNEINFSKSTIPEIIKTYSNNDSTFYNLINNYFENNKFNIDKGLLNEQEIDFIQNYFKLIGGSDKQSQLNYLEYVDNEIQSKVQNSKIEEEKYKKLYIKMFFLIGLIIFILIL